MDALYHGEHLEILGRHLKAESVNLVYLDPPFNSAQNFNAFFQEKAGRTAASNSFLGEHTRPGPKKTPGHQMELTI